MNMTDPILRLAKLRPDASALVEGDRTISYRELGEMIARTAGHLVKLGVRRGDRIGLCLKDTAQHMATLIAVARAGGVTVSLDWRAPAAEHTHFIDALAINLILAEPNAHLPAGSRAIALDADWQRAVGAASPFEQSLSDWSDPFMISSSSGSTGAPKFTLLTHLRYHFAMAGIHELMELGGPQRYLSTLPLYYGNGRNSALSHLLRGDCVILYPSVFSAAEYVEVARQQQATVGLVVPSTVRQLLALSDDDAPLLPQMVKLCSGGAPLGAEEKQLAARRLTPNFHERYGTTETFVIATLRPRDFAERGDSVGQPHSLAAIEIVDDDDRALPNGTVGKIRYSGPGLAAPIGAAAEANFREGWYYPGELAWLDERGFIFLQGRISEVIMRSGTKIYPTEVEAALHEHPNVAEAAVIGRRNADNEEVVAAVIARGDVRVGDLIAHCRARLTPHKVPHHIFLLAELPKNTAGKVDRAALAKRLAGTAQ